MKYLLDTHILLWAISDSPQLSNEVKTLIVNSENEIHVSSMSEWEIVVKSNIGKLKLNSSFAEFAKQIDELLVISLPVTREHLNLYEQLPLYHRDPFDRIIIAQGITENLTIITSDIAFKNYEVDILLNT